MVLAAVNGFDIKKKLATVLEEEVSEAEPPEPGTACWCLMPPATDPLRALQTILKDTRTDDSDFVFYGKRLMRLTIEEALNALPTLPTLVTTPNGLPYSGLSFASGNCAVSLCRSGEAMEQPLKECARGIRICKMLVTDECRLCYARFTTDMPERRVILLYPVIATGNTILKAIEALVNIGVQVKNVYIMSLFATPESIQHIHRHYPEAAIIVSEITNILPLHFATKCFGTD